MGKRYIDFSELQRMRTSHDIYGCVKQIWENGNEWNGFSKVARPRSAFSLVVSDVTAEYTFPEKESVIAKRGDLVYIPTGEIYKVRFIGGGSDPDLFTLNFNLYDTDGEELIFADGLSLYKNTVTQKLCDSARSLSDAIVIEESQLKIQALFYELLFEICASLVEKREYCPIREGRELLGIEWNKNEKIGRYAALCGMSEGAFYGYFKRWTGLSPLEYRNSIRINAALSLLANTDLKISEISLRCGFDDPYYFSRMFKKVVGFSPKVYRIRWKMGLPE